MITTTGNLATRSSSSLVTPQLQAYADPQFIPTVDPTLLNYLVHETIRALGESERAATRRQLDQRNSIQQQIAALRLASNSDHAAVKKQVLEEEHHGGLNHDAAVRARLDAIGYRVGWATAERLARDRPRFPPPPALAPSSSGSSTPPTQQQPQQPRQAAADILELVKFICKDVWVAAFDKQVDNLRTNHRGVYVLYDQRLAALKGFPALLLGSTEPRGDGDHHQDEEGEEDKEERAALQRHVNAVLAFPSGLIRGALANLDVDCTVTATADLATLPQASFQIKTTPAPAPPSSAAASVPAPAAASATGTTTHSTVSAIAGAGAAAGAEQR